MTTIELVSNAAADALQSVIHQLPIPPYRGTKLPDIDYEAHPAYGALLPEPACASNSKPSTSSCVRLHSS